jgi:hypothetical protein
VKVDNFADRLNFALKDFLPNKMQFVQKTDRKEWFPGEYILMEKQSARFYNRINKKKLAGPRYWP